MMVLEDDPVGFDPADGAAFRSELYTLIEETDRRWSSERFWHSPQGRVCRKFESYPTLSKYVASVHFDPLQFGNTKLEPWPVGQPWIFFRAWISSYASETALNALLKIIEKKRAHYGRSQEARHVHLLIHYGRAMRYNTPYYGIGVRGFEDVATVAAQALTGKPLVFEKVYLLEALEPGVQAFEIYPKLCRCE